MRSVSCVANALFALAFTLHGCMTADRAAVPAGRPAPEIVGEDLDGAVFRLSDYRGKVVVLDFWGDW